MTYKNDVIILDSINDNGCFNIKEHVKLEAFLFLSCHFAHQNLKHFAFWSVETKIMIKKKKQNW